MTSPFDLLQERQLGMPYQNWRILVVCALLNRTHGRQVRPIVEDLFETYPSPYAMIEACEASSPYLLQLLTPLGLVNRRRHLLHQLSCRYLLISPEIEGAISGEWALRLPGCGQYAVDSLNIFSYGRLENPSSDTWLQRYVDWRRTQNAG